jgi:hypothetical protein
MLMGRLDQGMRSRAFDIFLGCTTGTDLQAGAFRILVVEDLERHKMRDRCKCHIRAFQQCKRSVPPNNAMRGFRPMKRIGQGARRWRNPRHVPDRQLPLRRKLRSIFRLDIAVVEIGFAVRAERYYVSAMAMVSAAKYRDGPPVLRGAH